MTKFLSWGGARDLRLRWGFDDLCVFVWVCVCGSVCELFSETEVVLHETCSKPTIREQLLLWRNSLLNIIIKACHFYSLQIKKKCSRVTFKNPLELLKTRFDQRDKINLPIEWPEIKHDKSLEELIGPLPFYEGTTHCVWNIDVVSCSQQSWQGEKLERNTLTYTVISRHTITFWITSVDHRVVWKNSNKTVDGGDYLREELITRGGTMHGSPTHGVPGGTIRYIAEGTTQGILLFKNNCFTKWRLVTFYVQLFIIFFIFLFI